MSPRAQQYMLVGIVDNDKKLDIHCKGFFRDFVLTEERDRLLVKRYVQANQHIIVIDKAIESFLLWNAETVDIDVSQYGFEKSVKRLGLQLKTPTIETDVGYHQLLTDIYNRQAPGLITLERILNDLTATH